MGQKVNPIVQRVGINKDWLSHWFAPFKDYPKYVIEDYNVRKFIKKRLRLAAVSKIIIDRVSDKIKVKILTARPGIIIGRHGQDIERLKEDISNLVSKELSIDIEEIKEPTHDAQLVAENIAFQLERRVAFRRAIKRAIGQSMASGVMGIKISIAGRLGGAEMSRRETYKEGKIPLATLRADIDYGFAEALTTYGLIGAKVWIYKGDSLINKDKADRDQQDKSDLK
jgi:small subunit ribosomal protein S3